MEDVSTDALGGRAQLGGDVDWNDQQNKQQLAKFEELLAALAEQQKLGDVAKLTGRDRAKLVAMADAQLEKWRLQELRLWG